MKEKERKIDCVICEISNVECVCVVALLTIMMPHEMKLKGRAEHTLSFARVFFSSQH